MKKPVDNLFTFYRGPSHRDAERYHPGKQLEDNATKSLLNVLEETHDRDQAVFTRFLTGIEDAVPEATVSDPDLSGWEINTQKSLTTVDNSGITVLIGLSKSGDDSLDSDSIADGEQPDNESQRRLDAALTHESAGVTVVIESKFNFTELEQTQLQAYAAALGVSESEYATITWRDIYEWFGEGGFTEDSIAAYLVNEFRTYLEYWVLEFELSTSAYSGGDNVVKLVRNQRPLRESCEMESEEREVVLQFRTVPDESGESRGPRVQFTQSEWRALIRDLDKRGTELGYEFLSTFRGEFPDESQFGDDRVWKPVRDCYKEEGGHTVIASIGEDDSVRKVLRIDESDEDDKALLTFQTWSEGNSALRGSRPMFDKGEFHSLLYGDGDDEAGLTADQRAELLSPEATFEKLFR